MELSGKNSLSELKMIARYTRTPEKEAEGRERLIRFLDSYQRGSTLDPLVDSLCGRFGLFPYMGPNRDALSAVEAIQMEFHRPDLPGIDEQFVFHQEQVKVFHRLLDGESVVLSAPTSFGKSAILDAVLASGRWGNVAVLVPTIALIDEVRRRVARFSGSYAVITRSSQVTAERNIFVMTQERLLEFSPLPDVDFFMMDEFYKLSSADGDHQRMSLLNIAWHKLRRSGAQFYLTGPNVKSLSSGIDVEVRNALVVSDYQTVAVDVEDRSHVEAEQRTQDLKSQWRDLAGPVLVFVSSQQRAETVASDVSGFEPKGDPSEFAVEVSEWIGRSFHSGWEVVSALRSGVGVHMGSMPRSLQRIMVRLFERGEIEVLVCTTTLIEGVNTSARSIVIYDKSIDGKKIDYFTYSNIRGRAGRMRRHFVGKVLTYMAPPSAEEVEVDIPIESQPGDAPLSSLVHLSEGDLKDASAERLAEVVKQQDLSLGTIRANFGIDPHAQLEAARQLLDSEDLRAQLRWTGLPSASQERATLEFVFEALTAGRARRGMSAKRLMGMLQSARELGHDLGALVDRQMDYKRPDQDLGDVVRDVLQFQRNWMGFRIPSLLRALQKIFNEVSSRFGEGSANYEMYGATVESLFLPPGVVDLDEYGLPVPLTLKLLERGMRLGPSLDESLQSFATFAAGGDVWGDLTQVERWILEDVLEGLGRNQRSSK